MENRAHALIAGLFVLFLLLAAALSLWWFSGKREATTEYLVVTQQNVSGLSLQGQVRYRGIRVGRVESIRLDPENPRDIVIRISISQDIPVTRGTTAKLGYQGMTGIAHVLLEDSGQHPALLDGAGGLPRIPMQPSLLQELSDSSGATLRQAQMLLTSMNELLNPENRARISRTLANLENGSAGLAATLAEARKMLADPRLQRLGPAIVRIEEAAGRVGGTFGDIRVLVPRLVELTGKIDRMVGETNGQGLAAAGTQLHDLSQELTQTLRRLSHALQSFEDTPQSVIFGAPAAVPGPGEPGFISPAVSATN